MADGITEYLYKHEGEDGFIVYVIDRIFNEPLYAYYVAVIERYQDGDIQGTLMTQPFEFFGPFADYEEARIMASSL